MSPYSPDFNPIEHWWSQLKTFLRQFSPTTTFRAPEAVAFARRQLYVAIVCENSQFEKL